MSLTGCVWAQHRGDAGKSGFQPFESALGVLNVSRLAPAWTGPDDNNGAAISGGVVYDPTADGLVALDAEGFQGCSGLPKTCAPLWTGVTGGGQLQVPAVANGIVWVQQDTSTLLAFDAAGVRGCGGTPKTCTPLWSASAPIFLRPPTVAGGLLFISATDGGLRSPAHLLAFDAAGVSGCSGIPKTCLPLWTGIDPSAYFDAGEPAVANGRVYVGTDDFTGGHARLAAFDTAGVVGCSGSPKVCAPLWTATAPSPNPTVVNGVVYSSGRPGTTIAPDELDAFDAAGVQGCSGMPKTCAPLWTAPTPSSITWPAVDGSNVFVSSANGLLYAFDAKGAVGCSGTPKTCAPRWTANLQAPGFGTLIVANGVVYASTRTKVLAFDAAGTGCAGTTAVCQPLWVSPDSGVSGFDLLVVNGTLFANAAAGIVAYNVPPT
jgi:outer membrane protein assembly factor BamB